MSCYDATVSSSGRRFPCLLRGLILLASIFLVACPPPEGTHTPTCMSNCTEPASVGLDGSGRKINQLVRTWWVTGTGEQNFAFHAYLLFDDRAQATLASRKAAMDAVLRLFSDTEMVVWRIRIEELAVLAVPVQSGWALEATFQLRDKAAQSAALLDVYDYEVAQGLQIKLETAMARELPPLCLVGYPKALSHVGPIDLDQLYVIDLSDLGADEIEARLLRFRDALQSSEHSLSDTHESAGESARSYFDAWGELASSYTGE
jgi:hypothetical protein